MRLVDESDALRDAFPVEYVDLAVVVTDLGSSTVLMFILALLFWLTRRRETALIVSYAFAGYVFILVVKTLLGMPRPPEAVHLIAVDGDAYGFPSGHAFAAVVVYGGLYSVFEVARRRLALAVVATLVVLVSLSRVVLGMHHLGDVVVGAALGVAFLFAMGRLTDGDPVRGFALALVIALALLAITGVTQDALFGLGGAVGGILGSLRLESLPALRSRLEGAVLAVVGVGFIVGVTALESAVEAAFTPALLVLYAGLILGLLLVPLAVGRVEVGPLERGLRAQ
ncbi:phosphatase PAP2 family protein [Natronobiforma cellulositropha]|uniref:phosphatase PAP2 family protein n=1 Tax=Natronobiforma cellulositropha TaxID=1679076 RepID=UPI0021D598CD|nr:phosphatase PAP2 family protein [Natronobiforma cellulositropha]